MSPSASSCVPLPSAAGGNGGHVEVLIDEPNVDADNPTVPSLVLLPSSMRDARDLGTLAALLAQAGFRVLRPQPPGMGSSSAPRDGLTLHHLACDVAHAIATLGGGSAIVAGHAWGHFVARVTDLDHPHCVRGVVVLAGAARHFPLGLSDALDVASDTAQSTATRLAALQQAFFAAGNDPTPWLEAWHPHLRDVYRQASITPDKQVWWPVSHAPILDLQGAQDPWRPEATRGELRAALGDKATVLVIANASHALPHEQPTAVATAIVDWARTLPVSGP